MAGPKFPKVHVKLVGESGNAFVIASRVRMALEKAGEWEAALEYFREALSGDYSHVIETSMDYVDVS